MLLRLLRSQDPHALKEINFSCAFLPKPPLLLRVQFPEVVVLMFALVMFLKEFPYGFPLRIFLKDLH